MKYRCVGAWSAWALPQSKHDQLCPQPVVSERFGASNTRASQHHVATNLGFTLALVASLGTLQGLGGQGSRINDRFFLGASAFAI